MKKLKITAVSVLIMILTFTTTCLGANNIFKGNNSEINAANMNEGYVKIKYLKETDKKLKVIISKGSEKYTYDLNNKGEYDIYPLQMGDGKYKIAVYENITETKYSNKQTANIDVKLNDENSPFLIPSQYVNFTESSEAVKKADELTDGINSDIDKVDAIYNYVISSIIYDNEKAKTVKSGYLPNVDEILKSNKGICFDYAAIMAAMLRSQSIPSKLVTGYSSNISTFHAWNEVYTKETGWIKLNEIYFDGKEWKLMDSTIASSAKQSGSPTIIEYTNKLIDSKYYNKQYEY